MPDQFRNVEDALKKRSFSICACINHACFLIIGTLLLYLAGFGAARAEVIDWNTRPATDLRAGATDTVTYGTSSETSVISSGTFTGTFTTPNDLAIQPTTTLNTNTGILVSRFNATTDNESAFNTITLTFNEPVYNLSLLVGDIDGGPTSAANPYNDIVEFRGISPANAVVLPTSGTPNTPANVNWIAATGRATANNYNATANEGNITVVFAGPVKTVTIRHLAGANSTVTDPGQQMIFLETVSFTRGPRLVVQKTSTGGTGAFTFNVNNRLNAPSQAAVWTSTTIATNVTTTVAGTPVTGSNNTLFAIATATTITETGPVGWLVTSASCSDSNSGVTGNPATFGSLAGQVVTIPATNVRAGSVITCSLNNIQQPRLTLVKTVTNDNGGTATTSSVTLSATGPTTISGISGAPAVTNAVVTAGTYTLAETALPNYTASAWSCTAGTLTGSSLVLANGQNAVCTINNNDVAPRLTLVKTITNDNGGTATTAAFTLSAAGPTNISGVSGSGTVTNVAVNAGTYTLSETNVAGYTAGTWACTAGTLTGSSLVLTSGQTATCTINNNDVAPRLTLVKTITNDNGGTATTSSVTLSASGPTTISGVSGAASVTNVAVNAGTYSLSETALANYTPGAWNCTSGTLTGSSLVLSIGQTATCTINNDDIAPRLTLVKTVTNDNGGTATAAAFTLTATGPTTISGLTGAAAVTNAIVTAGTYALSENTVAGYAAGAWSCTAGTLTGSSLAIGIGQSATCTINNNDIGPVLTLVKTITNDNGGTATLSNFTLSAAGPVTISGTSGAVSVTNANVSAGTYALSETNVTGYAAGAWSCTAGTLAGSNLTLALGQTATCTINNNDIAPRLTLVKTITNDNGGTATTAAFTLTATGPTTINGVSGAGSVTNAAVNVGTYVLSETNLAGYAAGAWSCTAGTLTGSSLALSLGQTATCTINNNDIAPVLTLVKTVTDTSGGPSTVGSFTLSATGPITITGVTGAPAVTSASVSAGTYALSEAGPSGYTAGTWACTAGTLTGSSLVLSLGQTSTCTINNIKLPTLTIRKISNGGTGAFGFSGTNGVATENITTTAAGGTFTGTLTTLTAHDTATQITETMPATFWQIQSATCTGMGTGGTATLLGNVLTLDSAATSAGRNIVCTFTNRRRPTVSVQKITTGAAGGAFSFADTNLTGTVTSISTTATNTATPAVPARLIATTTGVNVALTETSPLTFVVAGVTCSDANSLVSGNTNPVAVSATGAVTIPGATVRVGADINCVFTNAQASPQLSLVKTASVPTVSAAGSSIAYTLAVTNSGNTSLNNISVSDPLGTVICPSSGAASVTSLSAGASENCTLNYTVPQSVFDSNGGGDGDIDNSATASATYNATPLSASDVESVGLVITPGLTVVKIPNTTAPQNAGSVISYTYRVTNSGNITMNNVTINDTHVGYGTLPVPGNEVLISPAGSSTDAAVNGSWDALAPGDVIEFTSTYTVVQADIDNLQ